MGTFLSVKSFTGQSSMPFTFTFRITHLDEKGVEVTYEVPVEFADANAVSLDSLRSELENKGILSSGEGFAVSPDLFFIVIFDYHSCATLLTIGW